MKSGTASAKGANKKHVLHVLLGCGSLANEFDVRSVWHGQVILAAANQICAIHETIDGYKNLKIH